MKDIVAKCAKKILDSKIRKMMIVASQNVQLSLICKRSVMYWIHWFAYGACRLQPEFNNRGIAGSSGIGGSIFFAVNSERLFPIAI